MKSSSPHSSSASSRRQMQAEWFFHRAKYFYRPKTSWCVHPPNGGCSSRSLAHPGRYFLGGGSHRKNFTAESRRWLRPVGSRMKRGGTSFFWEVRGEWREDCAIFFTSMEGVL